MPARFAEEVANDSVPRGPNVGHMNGIQHGGPGGEIVISGVSGRFPESSSMDEFKKNLYDHVDMVNDDERRWEKGIFGLPPRTGKLRDEDIDSFDPQYFGVHQKQAEYMDPQLRLLLECTHEAMIDAGINPTTMRGTRTGVYIGCSFSEAERYWTDLERVTAYGLTGCQRAMVANRISFTFDFKGPSYTVDTACSSSLYALENAFTHMNQGKIDYAIVGGVNVICTPNNSMQFKLLGMLSPTGHCKAFDESGNGYVRSDACVVVLLQRSNTAKRIYASVLNSRTNTDGYKEQGITFPDGKMQNRLIRETYEEINMSPNDVTYVEAHGTGTKAGDPQEVNSITDFFCKSRKEPLLIGSVKSNMGHSESASGACSIAKILLAMETGIIPANLHFNEPNPDLIGILDGRLQVVDTNLKWKRGVVGLNSFGFGGANGHAIFKSFEKPKSITPRDGPQKLVVCSGRTYEAVQKMLDSAVEHRDDDEYLALINSIHSSKISSHFYRGYCVMDANGSVEREILECPEENRPVWFIYSGMGSQWPNMARDLLKFDVVKNSLHRCAEALRPEGVDLMDLLLNANENTYDDILSSFIAIASMQIALTDLLASLGIHPDGIIGHSVGEVACAYADGCFTPEQTILAAYWRGKSIKDTKLPTGKMAAVGLNWDEAPKHLPSDCYPVCYNSEDNCSISGPPQSIDKLVEKLSSEGIFAKAVKSSGYAFHSKYIADAGPHLRKSLDKVIPTAKNRSPRWISTSIPEEAWNNPIAKQSSAAYHVNNLLSPVLFYPSLKHVPKNAICVEIAPHGLLQAILKRVLGKDVANVSLIKRDHKDNFTFCLSNIGKIYAAGNHPQVLKLSRPINWPVGRGTPMLSPAVEWDHSQKFPAPRYQRDGAKGASANITIDLKDEQFSFITGHNIDGRVLYPATGYMTLVWQQFAKRNGTELLDTPVVMEDVVFHRATIMNKDHPIKFSINFFEGTGAFELCESGSLVVSGKIHIPEDINQEELPLKPLESKQIARDLDASDVYKELRLRGYDYEDIFRGIIKSDTMSTTGSLQWSDNWIPFMDTLLQFAILSKTFRELYLPTRIAKAVINPAKHMEIVSKLSKEEQKTKGLPVYHYSDIKVIKSGGVEFRGLQESLAQKRPNSQNPPTLERYVFLPQSNTTELHENSERSRSNALRIALHTIIENSESALKIRGVELALGRNADTLMAAQILRMIEEEVFIVGDVIVGTSSENEANITGVLSDTSVRVVAKDGLKEPVEQNCHFVFGVDLLSRPETSMLETSIASLNKGGFLILDEGIASYSRIGAKVLAQYGFVPATEQVFGGNRIMVTAKCAVDVSQRKITVIKVTQQHYNWVDDLKAALAKVSEDESRYVYLVSQGEVFGAVGLMAALKREENGSRMRMIYVQDANVEPFSLESPFYRKQLEKDLVTVAYRNGTWGTYRHLMLESEVATLQVEHAYVNTLVKGDLSSLKWVEGAPQMGATEDHMELCTVYYAPVNFRDVMLSSGKLAVDALPGDTGMQDCVLGLEFSGRDTQGRRIMAMVPTKSMATTCLASKHMIWQVPDSWSMEEASTVPCVYSTVYYALAVRGQMKKGEKILIHAGSGGVGQAAISVALHHGLEVFTTVGSKEKREFLKKRFPQLKDSHIGNSRDTSFEQMVMRETQGHGVDLVLNSLSDEKLQASVRCLGLNGRFLEIGKFDLSNNSPLGMSVFLKNTSFHGILLDSIMEGEYEMQDLVVGLVAEGIKNGAVRPLPTSVFNDQQVEQAFRFMASGKHIGKVVVKVRDEEDGRKTMKPSARLINAIPRTYMHPEKSYVIVGGLGGFGLEMTNWMVMRGARFVVLTSRSGIKSGYQALMVRRWQDRGVKVLIDTNDVATQAGCKKLLENANKLAAVGAIFNLAAVLRDEVITNQTPESFSISAKAKIDATKCLDQLSRTMCPELDYFVCFSSVSAGRGNVGQSNYAMSNSTMERICEQRQASGFPGTAIQWGAIGDTGLVIDSLGDNDTVISGTLPQRMDSCLQVLDKFLQQPHPVLASMVVADKGDSEKNSGLSLLDAVANILGLRDTKTIQDTATLAELGMDSLMGSEIKQTMERNFDLILSTAEIRSLTFGALKQMGGGGGGDQAPQVAAAPTSNSGTTNGVAQDTFGDGTQVVFAKELLPTEALIRLKTSAPEDTKKRPVFFVSPIEGFATSLERLAERLDCPAFGLQCTADAPLDSVDTLAQFYVQKMRKAQPQGPYSIAGYSFGGTIAYVMASQLEQAKETVKLVMLDGAPKYVNWYTSSFKQRINTTNDQHQNEAYGLAYFAMVLANADNTAVAKQLLEVPTFEGKLQKVADIIAPAVKHPKDLLQKTASLFFKKLVAADKFKPTHKLQCAVTLVKPTENYAQLEEDYGLKEVCSKPVQVLTVKGNHRTFLSEQSSLETIEPIIKRLIA